MAQPEKQALKEFLVVYEADSGNASVTPKMALIDGALHIRQMVVDVENYIAQESSRRLIQKFRDGELPTSVVDDLKYTAEANDENLMFYSWNELKGFMRGTTKSTGLALNRIIIEVQSEHQLKRTYGAIKAAKEVGNPITHPTDLWDEKKMFAAIDAIFSPNRRTTRSTNHGLRTLYAMFQATVFENLIRD